MEKYVGIYLFQQKLALDLISRINYQDFKDLPPDEFENKWKVELKKFNIE